MTYASLFAGIGGFDLALNRLGHKCVYVNEWDEYAAQTYEKNFGHKPDTRDLTTVDVSDIPDHDILTGGFPCQAFSVAGRRLGFEDTRGTLFYDIARIAKAKRPSYLFLENVKGLLSHDNNRTFQTILRTFDELGYELQWQVLNSKNFGVPQNRERVFIIGHLRGKPGPKVFPIREGTAISDTSDGRKQEGGEGISSTIDARYGSLRNSGETYIVPTIRATQHKSGDNQTVVIEDFFPDRIRAFTGSPTLRSGRTGLKIAQRMPLKFLDRNQKNIEGDYAYTVDSMNTGGVMITEPSHKHGEIREYKDIVPTMQARWGTGGNNVPYVNRIRKLTPIECERLQGFPEVEKSVIIELCLDPQKNSVNAENENHKLQKPVGNVEKTGLQGNVKSVELNINTKPQQKNKPVQPDVLINCVENGVEILSQGKSLLNVHTAINNDSSALQMPIESFVRLIAGITQIVEQITQCGKEELQAKGQSLIVQGNGENYVKLFGIEKTQLAKGVRLDSTTLKELTKYIMSYPSGLKASDTNLQTLFSYVTRAISGYIQELIPQKSSLVFQLNTKLGYTYGVSDTQRYKQLGNAVTVNVVYEIAKRAFMEV